MFKGPNLKKASVSTIVFLYLENGENTNMELKDIELETILRPFWAHLGILGRPLEDTLGVLGPTWANIE